MPLLGALAGFSQPASARSGKDSRRSQTTPTPPGQQDAPARAFRPGEFVEYFSATSQRWIPARVLAVSAQGAYRLDCKPDVPASKIRPPHAASGQADRSGGGGAYAIGDSVEYFSTTAQRWIPAKVVGRTPVGTYDLDCKPDVLEEKIRRAQGGGSAADEGPGGRHGGGVRRPAPAQERPVQLLAVRREGQGWRYEVCDEGARVLEAHGERRIAVAAICGAHRSGKSYLLSLLSERVQKGRAAFEVGSTSRACTEGLWLWSGADADNPRGPLLAFVDCEGFGNTESDHTRDAQLMALCSLLSSVLVLNTKGALSESLLSALALTCRFAEHIEEGAGEANRPSLLWVLRDFALELLAADGQEITADEYLEQALSVPASRGRDRELSRGQLEVRQTLQRYFGDRGCFPLVQPVIEEGDLASLDALPYTALRHEFRASVEALRMQLLAACRANPKAVAGQPLGCRSFVDLMRQLVNCMNEGRALSVPGAWDAVQHTTCGALSDELHDGACRALRSLASGKPLLDAAEGPSALLPMSNESLNSVLEKQRKEVRSEWDRRAVGDESVRQDYWRELEMSLMHEESVVRTQNTRLGDQLLRQVVDKWQQWLDDDTASWSVGEGVCKEFGDLAQRAPAAAVSRAAKAVLEASGQHIDTVRGSMAALSGGARADDDSARAEMQDNRLRQAMHAEQMLRMELQAKSSELHETQQSLQSILADMEASRSREQEMRVQNTGLSGRESSLLAELDQARAAAARADSERSMAFARAGTQRMTLSAQRDIVSEAEELHLMLKQVTQERDALKRWQGLQGGELASAREEDLQRFAVELVEARAKLEKALKDVEAARQCAAEERAESREREACLRVDLDRMKAAAASVEAERIEAERVVRAARWEADAATAEQHRLQAELEHLQRQADSHERQLAVERQTLRGEHDRARAERLRLLEEMRQRMDEERRAHTEAVEAARSRLLEREHAAGELQGQNEAVSAEAVRLRRQAAEQQRARDQLAKNLEIEKQQVEELRIKSAEMEAQLQRQRQAKCGCAVQ